MDDLYNKYSGGYTSLPTSNLTATVPVAVDDQQKGYPYGESNLQIFPPNNGQGSSAEPASGNGDNGQPSNSWKGVFSLASYQPYFNVDTFNVVERILLSLYPHHGDFITKISSNPDLYGPVWISTTLVFLVSVLGNYAAYLSFKPSGTKTQWVYDINYVNVAAAIFYGYIFLVPLGCYFMLLYLGVASSLVQLLCLYGYSMFIFIPALFLLIIPVEILRWLIILLAGLESAFFVALNIHSHVRNMTEKWTIPVVSSFIVQLVLTFAIKFYFFA